MSIRTHATVASATALVLCAAAPALHAAIIPVTSYAYTSGPSGSYPDSTGTELTDGVIVNNDIVPTGPWVGWDGSIAIATFDLGTLTNIGKIDIAFLKWGNAAVYAPDFVQFDFSATSDFAVSTTQTFSTTLDLTHGGLTEIRSHDLSFPTLARYVRLTADHDRQWLFIGEVTFDSIPTPGAAALLGLGGLIALRRRR